MRVNVSAGLRNRGIGGEAKVTDSGESEQTEKLVALAVQGDGIALNELFAMHRAYLRRVIELRLDNDLRSRVDPSDVIQETLLEAARRIHEYLGNRAVPFRIWLRRTAIEQMVSLRRHHILAEKRNVQKEVRFPDHSSIALAHKLLEGRASQILQKKELAQQVRAAIAEMGDLDREMLLLRHVEELTNQEIAALLEIDTSTASQRYGRSLIRFRDKLISIGILGDAV